MNRISNLRKQANLSQNDLGKIIGVAQNTLSQWENGLREPDFDSVIKISEYFNVSTDYLLGKEEDMPDELIVLNRIVRKLSKSNRKKLVEIAKMMFAEDFDNKKF